MGQSGKPVKGKQKSADELRQEIAQTRAQMSHTAGAIEETLPQAIKGKAQETVGEVKQIAKDAFHQAKDAAVEQFQETKAAVRQEVSEQVREAKYAVRRATIGRAETMVHRAQDSVTDTSETIIDTIRANPVPAALVGIGLAWLFMSGRSQRAERPRAMRSARSNQYGTLEYGDYPYGYQAHGYDEEEHDGVIDRGREAVRGGVRRMRGAVDDSMHDASEMAHDLGDRVQGAASNARRAAGDFAEHTADRAQAMAVRAQREARHLGHEASLRARRAERGAEHIYRESPLAVGAAAIAVGAMIGLALPHTEREDELMGSVRDRLVDDAEQMASGAVDKAKDVAKEKLASGNGDRVSANGDRGNARY